MASYFARLFNPTFVNPTTGVKMPNDTGWQTRHVAALRSPHGPETGIALMLEGWAKYADAHRARYESGIGEDYVLGDEWETIGRSIRALLNGECGRFDCGTLDAFLSDTLHAEGFDPDCGGRRK